MQKYSNIAQSSLSAVVSDMDTTITINSVAKFPSSCPFTICVCSLSNSGAISNYELMLVTSCAGNVFTVTRGLENTPVLSHSSGEVVANVLTAGMMESLTSLAFSAQWADILNPPSIPAAQIQSDWNESDTNSMAFIKNKPSFLGLPTTSALSLSLVGTGATGTQISSTKPSMVIVTVSVSATATIGGASTSLVTLKKCATNSSTEGDWTSIGPAENDQSYTLAIAISGTNKSIQQITTNVPIGWFVKTVSGGSGTHTESIVMAEKTIYG